jgi:general nucleoside transport system permease protein
VTATPSLGRRLIAVAIAVVISAAFIGLQSSPTGSVWESVWLSTFGSPLGIGSVLQLTMPLVVAGCAAALAQRAGLWNIGIQGQMVMGAWLGTVVAYTFDDLIGALLIPFVLIASAVGGGLWVLGPALGRALLGMNEIITTLLLNFVAFFWLDYWAGGRWADLSQNGGGTLISRSVTEQAHLPQFMVGDTSVGLAIVIAVVLALVLWLVFRYTSLGYDVALTRSGTEVASYAGVSAARVQFLSLMLSGAVGGLAGGLLLLDQVHSFSSSLVSDNSGYIGIIVAALAAGSFLGILPAALLLGVMTATGNALQIVGVSGDVVFLITGILLIIACANLPSFRPRWRRAGGAAPP